VVEVAGLVRGTTAEELWGNREYESRVVCTAVSGFGDETGDVQGGCRRCYCRAGLSIMTRGVDEAEVGNGVEEVVLLGWTWIRSVNLCLRRVYCVSPNSYIYTLCYTKKIVRAAS
jgi:hypothetical protein